MLKKFLWLVVAVVFLCSPLWANNDNPWNEYLFAAADQKQPASISSTPKVPLASPLDLCDATNTCVRLDSILPCTLPGGLPIGSTIYAFQDPAKACPPPATCPTYPFEVKAVHVMLTNCQAAPCVATLKPSILAAVYPTDPNCPVPGNMLCQGPEVTVNILPNQCIEYVLPIKETCCVNEPYFASVEILTTDCGMLEVCTDRSCDTCCNYVKFPGAISPIDACLNGASGDFALWTDGVLSCQNICPKVPADTGSNHFQGWNIGIGTVNRTVLLQDQFMIDTVTLVARNYLFNPVQKVVGLDTFDVTDTTEHLTWYFISQTSARDTSITLTYVNQIESTEVTIGRALSLLVPTKKLPHAKPQSLDHYKCYQIQPPFRIFEQKLQLKDQFDPTPYQEDSLAQYLFCTPCQKNNEPTFDTLTHYVAYLLWPNVIPGTNIRTIVNQFDSVQVTTQYKDLLLVPTRKKPVSQPADTLRNHFKTWRILSPPKDTFALVRDQFTTHDFLFVDSIDFLSNPVRKIVSVPPITDTSEIQRPDDHLTWYRVNKSNNRRINVQVTYVNQFESTKVFIDTVKYFLLPTQKLLPLHPAPDSLLGHYTAYRIHKPKVLKRPVQLDDQFDVAPELIDSLVPKYFLTPAKKNNEPAYDPDTHYVAYEIFPKTSLPALTTQTIDQWGGHAMQIRNSEYLLVPSRKDTFVVCTHKPNDCNGDGTINLSDIICDVNVVFKPGTPKPVPNCRCDSDGNGTCNLTDIIYKVNYVFRRGPEPVPSKECCIPVK